MICHTGFADSLRARSGWNLSSVLILLASCQQTCVTYTYTYVYSARLLMMDRRTVRNMYFKNKFEKLVHLVGLL